MNDLPWCAVCQTPVEELCAFEDARTMALIYVVRCHGSVERVEISMSEQMHMVNHSLRIVEAFHVQRNTCNVARENRLIR